MSDKYLLKTKSGSLYEVVDESHLWRPDTWIIMVKGLRHVIMYLGNMRYRQNLVEVARGQIGQGQVGWKVLEKGVGHNISSSRCIGKCVVYVEESLLKAYMKTRNLPKEVWNAIQRRYGQTTRVVEVYLRIR